MMEIVATSDLIRPKPTYDPRIITSRFSPRRESPSLDRTSPYSQYSRSSSPSRYNSNQQSPPHQLTTLNQSTVKLPTVSIPFVTTHGLVYAKHSPKGLVLSSDPSSKSPGTSPTTTPTTSLPTPPATQTTSFIQQPTPTRLAPKKIYTCKLCGKTFNNSGNFSRHQKVHTGEKPYRCEICGKAFTQSSTLKRHILSHSGDRSYKCQVCSKGYVDPWSLKKHMKNHGFNTYSHVQVKPILPHYKFHPPNVVVPPKGQIQHHWMKPEITPPGLYLPLSSEQPSPTMPTFKSGGSAFTTVESKIAKPGFAPPVSGYNPTPGLKEGDTGPEIKKEEGTTPVGEGPEGGEKPDALILYIDTLKQSIKTYQDNKPESDTKENGGDNIMQFTPTRQLAEKENEMYMCDKCGRSFNNLNNFKTHQVIHAGSLACNGELACHQCKAVFLTKQQLQAHMTTHTSSYWCVYCERSFRNEYNFKQHQTVHTTLVQEGDKKYPAWLESFRQEMMTCVTSLDTPMPVPPVNTPATAHSHTPSTAGICKEENEEVDVESSESDQNKTESPKNKIRKVSPSSPSSGKRALSKLAEIKELKMKAMMDIDPLGHAMIPKFCHPSVSSHYYSATSAGSAYSAATPTGSAASSRSSDPLRSGGSVGSIGSNHHSAGSLSMDPLSDYPHDIISRPHSAGTMPHSSGTLPIHPLSINGLARPLPHSAGGHVDDQSRCFKLDPSRSLYMEDRMRAIKSSYIDESSYIPRSGNSERRSMDGSWSTEIPRLSQSSTELRHHNDELSTNNNDRDEEKPITEKSPEIVTKVEEIKDLKIEELEAGTVGEERSTKRPKISYQCCMCSFNSTKLSDLTLHLEKTHHLGDYELIKMLLACLGDIGA